MHHFAKYGGFGVALTLMFVALTGCFDRESKQESAHPYDETADASRQIAAALDALGERQRLLLVFGANWCPDCRRVDASMSQPQISASLQQRFSIVKVDVGRFDKNMTLSEYYGLPTRGGIPAMAIVDREDRLLRMVHGRELAQAHKQGREGFQQWLERL